MDRFLVVAVTPHYDSETFILVRTTYRTSRTTRAYVYAEAIIDFLDALDISGFSTEIDGLDWKSAFDQHS